VVYFEPRLAERLDGLKLRMQFRGTPIRVSLDGGELNVEALADGFSLPLKVGVGDEVHKLSAGERCTFDIGARSGVA
jgi:hypothetical protein